MNLIKRLAYCACIIVACSPTAFAREPLEKIVAVVNDEVIAQSELDDYARLVTSEIKQQPGVVLPPKEELQKQILGRMITDKIQLQLAKQSGIEIDSFTISQTIQELAAQQKMSVDEFKREIESRGITFNEYRDLIKTEITMQSIQAREVAQDITVAKHEVDSFLNSAAGQDQSGNEYQLGHILLAIPESPSPEVLQKSLTESEELVQTLRSGEDFSKTAMSKSSGRQALNGGDLGWRTTAELPTLFVNYVPSMQPGDIIGPIRSTGGIHIIKLIGKRSGDQTSREEMHVKQILITPGTSLSSDEAKDIIVEIHKQLTKGADFSKLAEKKSHDKRSANKGGDLGWVEDEVVPAEFAKTMHNLRNGEISKPFLTDEGWTIVQVIDRRTHRTSDEAALNHAMNILTARKTNEALEAWTKSIRDEAEVEILLSDLQN